MWLEFLGVGAILAYMFYRWATKNNDFFLHRGIPYNKPCFLLGDIKDVMFRKESFFEMSGRLYRKGENNKVFGIFDQRDPMFLIRDLDLLKEIIIKDFDHFMNHRTFMDNDGKFDHDLFSNTLFQMKNSKWKDMRSTLSPAFTGSKMRLMFELINQVSENASVHLKSLQKGNKDGIELELKDFCTRFTNDIIASTAFGLQVNSFKDMDNQFYKMGKKVTNIKILQFIKFMIYANFKFLIKIFKFQFFGKETTNYFMHLVLDAMKYRKEHNIIRPDMINMLMEARGLIPTENVKHHSREWTDLEIVAQCFAFFFAGFDTTAILMCFTAQELMENPDVQQRLYEEIEEVNNNLDGKTLTYEDLQGMKYMDMVVSEVLRKWPPSPATDRLCTKDFEYIDKDGITLNFKQGDVIWIPMVGFHHDPKYFPNPEKFDPERFSNENKHQIETFAYMPFGMGPRNCIGSRFALLETKALIYYMVRDFRIEVGEKTSLPFELSKKSLQTAAKNGFWMKFTSRKGE